MYQTATYAPSSADSWYHFLYGYAPGHQIEFIAKPETPADFTPQHFSHLSLLIGYIEPEDAGSLAFGFLNLSRDDTQREAGYGGIALVLAIRVHGAEDHRGRPSPPFAHTIIAVDRSLHSSVLSEAASVFYQSFFMSTEGNASAWYRSLLGSPEAVSWLLPDYLARYAALPTASPSTPERDLQRLVGTLKRTFVVYDEDTSFSAVLHRASQITCALYRSNIRWTAVFFGRDSSALSDGCVRFIPRSLAPPNERNVRLIAIDALPDDPARLLELLLSLPSLPPPQLDPPSDLDASPAAVVTTPARSAPQTPALDSSTDHLITSHATEPSEVPLDGANRTPIPDISAGGGPDVAALERTSRRRAAVKYLLAGILVGVCADNLVHFALLPSHPPPPANSSIPASMPSVSSPHPPSTLQAPPPVMKGSASPTVSVAVTDAAATAPPAQDAGDTPPATAVNVAVTSVPSASAAPSSAPSVNPTAVPTAKPKGTWSGKWSWPPKGTVSPLPTTPPSSINSAGSPPTQPSQEKPQQ